MNATTKYALLTIATVLFASNVVGQEVVPAPAPGNTAPVTINAGDQAASAPVANAAAQQDANRWRYRWFNGRWWYWTPQSRWMWYSDDGRWIEYDANHAPQAAVQTDNSAGYAHSYYPAYGYYGYRAYYPRYGYWGGYYPGVAVGVWPYGNVEVGVGRRVGVNVWGPRGAVRVGRIYVGW
jgi:hypothetical protein